MLKYLRSLLGGTANGASGQAGPPAFTVLGAALTDAGGVREGNEDRVFLHVSPPDAVPSRTLALVLDGMGGVSGGAVASEMAAQLIPPSFFASRGSPDQALRHAIKEAHRAIFKRGRKERDLKGMGTTCVALVLSPPHAWAAWVGDSRLYLIRDGSLFQLTEDHTVVQEMVRRGLLTAHEAAGHVERNLVTRALGVRDDVEVDAWKEPMPVRRGDRFLLCSDGLNDTLSDDALLTCIKSVPAETACGALIAEAVRCGATDNVSAVVLEVAGPPISIEDLAQTRQVAFTELLKSEAGGRTAHS